MSKIINTLIDKKCDLPIWFMRQAGRHLPEFRKIRSNNKDFIRLCLNSKLSAKITLQPLIRYDIDAAIIFSDILLIPYALGQKVHFRKKIGPELSEFDLNIFKKTNKKRFKKILNPVYQAIKISKNSMDSKKSLIGFIGAPWTLILYMFNLKKINGDLNVKKFKKKIPDIRKIMAKLTNFSCDHIKNQILAGSDIVQIFDTWAGLLPKQYINEFCIRPNLKIVKFCKKNKIPVICFPKGLKKNYKSFVNKVKPDCISIDYDVNPKWAKLNLKKVCIQGGLNPKMLLKSEKKLMLELNKYLKVFSGKPYIFNLGHGIMPRTNPSTVNKIIYQVRSFNGK